MKYDDASWHYGGDFPADVDDSAGATHIGLFVTWCLLNGLAGKIHADDIDKPLEKLEKRISTPGEWFIRYCDEKFTDEDLSELGNCFASSYYAGEEAPYLKLYVSVLLTDDDSVYSVPDTWETYDRLAPHLRDGFDRWLETA